MIPAVIPFLLTAWQDLLTPVEVTVSLSVETSQSEIQELRLNAEYRREVQSIVVKAFAENGLASTPASEVAEKQLVTVEVRRTIYANTSLSMITAIMWGNR